MDYFELNDIDHSQEDVFSALCRHLPENFDPDDVTGRAFMYAIAQNESNKESKNSHFLMSYLKYLEGHSGVLRDNPNLAFLIGYQIGKAYELEKAKRTSSPSSVATAMAMITDQYEELKEAIKNKTSLGKNSVDSNKPKGLTRIYETIKKEKNLTYFQAILPKYKEYLKEKNLEHLLNFEIVNDPKDAGIVTEKDHLFDNTVRDGARKKGSVTEFVSELESDFEDHKKTGKDEGKIDKLKKAAQDFLKKHKK